MSSSAHPYHHGDLRRALLDAGVEVLAERGIDGLSLREVARRAGVSQAAPYHHFADRGALLSAIADEGYHELAEALRQGAREAGGSALTQFHGMGIAYVRFAIEHPAFFRLLFRPELLATTAGAEPAAGTESYRVFEEALGAAIAEGSVTGSLDEVALAAWCGVHGAATLLLDGPLGRGQRSWEEVANIVTVILGLGFIPRE